MSIKLRKVSKKEMSIKTYELNDKRGHMIDIVETADTYNVWIYSEFYGTKTLMFGVLKEYFSSYNELKDFVLANLYENGYLEIYDRTCDELFK